MKIFPHIAAIPPLVAILAGCMDLPKAYSDINTVKVRAVYPEGYADCTREGVGIMVENTLTGHCTKAVTDAYGSAEIKLQDGLYVISISDRKGTDIFNGTVEKVSVAGNCSIDIPLSWSEGGGLLIKEIYCGGCSMAPKEGKYNSDSYIIVHNNTNEALYLDSLCFGTSAPYNSFAANRWIESGPDGIIYQDFVPVVQAVWQIGGGGKDFKIDSGKDAVICIYGAIDHTINVPLSVNLNKEDYFVCYNATHFPNTTYHPAPGDRIRQDHYLDLVVKTGIANAYTLSQSSPAVVIFKAKGTTIQEFVTGSDNIKLTPGTTNEYVTAVPLSWILDGVEVFDSRHTANTKRLAPAIDAGYSFQSDVNKRHTIMRKVDAEASREAGYEVLQDTNNSINDFYERDTQSLAD